ncbi:hypothetical protein LTR81_001118 [Elasticomyces elasticus]
MRPLDRPEANINGTEVALAVDVLDTAAVNIAPPLFDALLQLIWKRCYIHDDWSISTSGGE